MANGGRFTSKILSHRRKAYFFVIPGWSAGPGPEPMNTGHSEVGEVCVHGFRALGLHPSPGMTNILDFLTAPCAGRTRRGASH
jgi:hypothetical protein